MKSIIKSIVLMAMVCVLAVSCDSTSSEAAYFTSVCCTVETDSYGSYVFHSDDNEIIRLSGESDAVVRKNYGTNIERIHLIIKYNESDKTVENGVTTIKNATVMQGTQKIDVNNCMTTTVAEEKNWLAKDSLFNIQGINEAYASNGYITIFLTAPYSIVNNYNVYPGINMIIDSDDIKENALTVHLLYNRHSAKSATAYNATFITSFPINRYKSAVPGTGDINVTVSVEGQDKETKTTFKMKR